MEQSSILRKLAWCLLLSVAVLSVDIITAGKTRAAGDTVQRLALIADYELIEPVVNKGLETNKEYTVTDRYLTELVRNLR